MKIIITGAGGFIGRKLIADMAGDHDIVAVDQNLAGLDGIEGDLSDPEIIAAAFSGGCDAVIHLATVPGGAAEANPALAKKINIDSSMALIDAAAQAGSNPRFIFASSIAVFGDPMPAHVDDDTPLAPMMLYGAHKALMEEWIATQTRRGTISGLSLRFPGVIARPLGPSGMKSAFMSDIFHALKAGNQIILPVSPQATLWLMSVQRMADNLIHAINGDAVGSITLPAMRTTMVDLVDEIAEQTGNDAALASYQPDAALEAAFGRQPPLTTQAAESKGFRHDGSLKNLVGAALKSLS